MPKLRIIVPLVLVACAIACAPVHGDMAVEAASAVGARDCLDLSRVVGQRGDGPRAIAFETVGGAFRNDLPEACPGLERPGTFTALIFEPKSGPLCRNDFVRVADNNQLGTLGIASGPRCRLGRFTPIPPPVR